MATFAQNIRKIRGEAIYGPDMRTAIADALEQAINLDISGEDVTTVEVSKIAQTEDDYLITFTDASSYQES